MRTFFVRYGTFFVHISTTPTTTTITKLLLGPLSIARGQKFKIYHHFILYSFGDSKLIPFGVLYPYKSLCLKVSNFETLSLDEVIELSR